MAESMAIRIIHFRPDLYQIWHDYVYGQINETEYEQ